MAKQPLTDHKRSVKRSDIGSDSQVMNFWLPYGSQSSVAQLPPHLPEPSVHFGLIGNERDKVLMSTVYHESMWGSTVGIVASKFAAAGWQLNSDKPRIQERFQNILINSTIGSIAGYVPFAAAGMASYLNTGKWIVEIERYTSRAGSRIKAFHHLDPLRCWLTTDPATPVIYIDRMGAMHELKSHQVMVFMDMPDPTESNMNAPLAAAVRAYGAIVKLSALNWYTYEKMSGRRPLAFHFLQGVNGKTLEDAIENAQATADADGISSYMGAAMAAIMGDVPLNLITVPLAEIPDGVASAEIRKDAHLVYANAVGEDPTRLDPQLIGNRQLGAGAQSQVLDQTVRQGGSMVTLKANFTHSILQLLRDEKIQFAFEHVDLRDEKLQADVSKTRAETRKIQVESGEIIAVQSANLAMDSGDLPAEFVPTDETMTDTLTDDEQPTEKLQTAEKEIDPAKPDEVESLIAAEMEAAQKKYSELENA